MARYKKGRQYLKGMKYIILSLTCITLMSCATSPNTEDQIGVAYKGALKNIMRKGDLSAKADLMDFQDVPNLYALGAVEDLKGEILILDGQPYISSAQNQALTINNNFNHKATLLVYASVDQWRSSTIPNHVTTYDDLEQYVEQSAKEHGINTDHPFPFLLHGRIKSFDWHVIDWKDGDMEHSHEKHITSGPHGTLTDQEVEILGFYSDSHHAVFTHHTTNMHLHVKTTDDSLSGHVDGLTLGQSMVLQLPDVK